IVRRRVFGAGIVRGHSGGAPDEIGDRSVARHRPVDGNAASALRVEPGDDAARRGAHTVLPLPTGCAGTVTMAATAGIAPSLRQAWFTPRSTMNSPALTVASPVSVMKTISPS